MAANKFSLPVGLISEFIEITGSNFRQLSILTELNQRTLKKLDAGEAVKEECIWALAINAAIPPSILDEESVFFGVKEKKLNQLNYVELEKVAREYSQEEISWEIDDNCEVSDKAEEVLKEITDALEAFNSDDEDTIKELLRKRTEKTEMGSSEEPEREGQEGFWDPHAAQWQEGFDYLKAYKDEHGDCLVPANYRNPDGFGLGQWVQKQRRSHRKHTLSTERLEKLQELGYRWNARIKNEEKVVNKSLAAALKKNKKTWIFSWLLDKLDDENLVLMGSPYIYWLGVTSIISGFYSFDVIERWHYFIKYQCVISRKGTGDLSFAPDFGSSPPHPKKLESFDLDYAFKNLEQEQQTESNKEKIQNLIDKGERIVCYSGIEFIEHTPPFSDK